MRLSSSCLNHLVATAAALAIGIQVQSFQYPPDGTALAWSGGALIPVPQDVRAIAMVPGATFVVLPDGTVEGYGPAGPLEGFLAVPSELAQVVDVAASGFYAIALKEDGKLAAWGTLYEFGMELGPPILPPDDLEGVVAMGVGESFAVALTDEGRLVAWGDELPMARLELPDIDDGVAIAVTGFDGLVLRQHGRVAPLGLGGLWGVGPGAFRDITDAKAVAVGANHALILHEDGTVSGYGFSPAAEVPEGLSSVQAIAAESHRSLALRTDGTLVAWGNGAAIPEGLANVVAIHAGADRSMAWTRVPYIARQPESQAIEPGQPATLVVEAIDRGELTFQWWHEDAPIPGATTAELHWEAAADGDSGRYRVVVSNGEETVTSREAILAVGPPWIVEGPEPVSALALTRATFEVHVLSASSPTYQWLLNGEPIAGATDVSLLIEDLSMADEGDYSVEVGNVHGSVTSDAAHLTVVPNAPLDQSQTVSDARIVLRGGDEDLEIAQTFVAGISGLLDRIGFAASGDSNGVEWPTAIRLVEAPEGQPTGRTLARVVVDKLEWSTEVVWRDTPTYLVAGRSYAFVFSTDAPSLPYSAYSFHTSFDDQYAGGDLWQRRLGGRWQLAYTFNDGVTLRDLVFSTYMVAGIPPIRLTSPLPGAFLRQGEEIAVAAELAPDLPAPERVEFLVNDQLAGTVTEPPFTWPWTPSEVGRATLTARAVVGEEAWLSDPITVDVHAVGPPNDDFADATLVPGDYAVISVSAAGALVEPGEADLWLAAVQGSVWWEWIAPRSGPVKLAVTPPEPGAVWVGFFAGSAVETAVVLAQADGVCEFDAVAGQRYHLGLAFAAEPAEAWTLTLAQLDVAIVSPVAGTAFISPANVGVTLERLGDSRYLDRVELQIDGEWAATLPGALEPPTASLPVGEPGEHFLTAIAVDTTGFAVASAPVPFSVRPANDNYQNAIELAGHRVERTASNRAATRQAFEPLWGSNQGGHSIWYVWTAPADGLCTLGGEGLNPSTGDTFGLLLAAFRSGQPSLNTQVAENALNPVTGASWTALAGVTYWILVDGGLGEEGDLSFWLRLRAANDAYAAAEAVEGLEHQTLTSFLGATPDAAQSHLQGLSEAPSLWWLWQAPVDARATFTVSSPNGLLRVAVGTEKPAGRFEVLADSGPAWQEAAAVTLSVGAGTTYRVGVFAPPGSEPEAAVGWRTDILRVVSPRENSTVPLPSTVRLFAQPDLGFDGVERIEYRVNDVLAGTVDSPPFALSWEAVDPGIYRVVATAYAADGGVQSSLPAAFLAFAGLDLPQPRLFAGTWSDASYVVNALGELRLAGVNSGQFSLGPGDGLTFLRTGIPPAEDLAWQQVVGGITDYYWSPELNAFRPWELGPFASWALAEDGRLFRNGEESVPFPEGVTAWSQIAAGPAQVWALTDDGRVFADAQTPVTFPTGAIAWDDFGIGSAATCATLARDGRAFRHTLNHEGRWTVSVEIPRPSGRQWVAIEVASFQILLLDDAGRLHQCGTFGVSAAPPPTPTEVPFPEGVSRWESFSVGQLHVLALGDNGQVYSWGRNWEGQLGIGRTGNDVLTLSRVEPPPGVSRWSTIAAGRWHSLALGDDCALYAWGDNTMGQLGLGNGPPVTVPTHVPNSGVLCGFPVVYTEGETSRLPDGRFRLRFRSDRNRSYLIQYSDDLHGEVWRTAVPAVLGTGGVMEWIDDGPPVTETHPSTVAARFYRVVFD